MPKVKAQAEMEKRRCKHGRAKSGKCRKTTK